MNYYRGLTAEKRAVIARTSVLLKRTTIRIFYTKMALLLYPDPGVGHDIIIAWI